MISWLSFAILFMCEYVGKVGYAYDSCQFNELFCCDRELWNWYGFGFNLYNFVIFFVHNLTS